MPPRRAHARIQAQITGKGREVGAIEAYERTVVAVSRAVVRLEMKTATLARQLADTRRELKGKRRELRAILQRDSTITEDSPALAIAGRADAIDAAQAERPRTCRLCGQPSDQLTGPHATGGANLCPACHQRAQQ